MTFLKPEISRRSPCALSKMTDDRWLWMGERFPHSWQSSVKWGEWLARVIVSHCAHRTAALSEASLALSSITGIAEALSDAIGTGRRQGPSQLTCNQPSRSPWRAPV
jgi:hypothetical protein